MHWARRPWILAVLVALIGALVFVPAISGGWIYDDHILIARNQYVHSFSSWPRWFLTDFWNVGDEAIRAPGRIVYWRPLVSVTYALDWTVSDGNSTVFHITNYVWQALVGGLAFVVLRRWLGGLLWPGVFAALLFLVHPTKAESVAWIAGRTDVICMAALLIATQGVAIRLRNEHGGILLEVFGTLLAYTSKEQAIVLPAFVAIEAWVVAGRPSLDVRTVIALVRRAIPQIVVALGYLVIRHLVLPVRSPGMEGWELGFGGHLVLVLETFGRFVTLTFAPHDLSVQQGLVHFDSHGRHYEVIYVAIGIVSLIALATIALLCRRRAPTITLGIAFYIVTLTPTLNIVTTQMITLVSERFLYLPVFGLALAAGSLLVESRKRWLYALFAIAIAALATQSIRRSSDFADESSFWERELKLHPDSGEARNGRIRSAFLKRRYRTALLETLERARMANVTSDVEVAASIADLAARLTPDHDRTNLETIDAFCRDMLERKQPEAVLRLALLEFRIRTGSQAFEDQLRRNELTLIALRTSLRSRLGDDEGALALAQTGLSTCPGCPTTILSAAMALGRAGQYDQAFQLLTQSREVLPDDATRSVWSMLVKSGAEMQHAQTATGPEQLRARAAALSTLELWGRAYDVLAPHKDEIKRAPKFATGFAELAFRAGEPEVAREVLAVSKDLEEIERITAGWTDGMGWRTD